MARVPSCEDGSKGFDDAKVLNPERAMAEPSEEKRGEQGGRKEEGEPSSDEPPTVFMWTLEGRELALSRPARKQVSEPAANEMQEEAGNVNIWTGKRYGGADSQRHAARSTFPPVSWL